MEERRRSGEAVLERRRTPRVPLRTEVTCRFGGVSLSAATANLTATGCFVETETPVPEHTAVDVTFHLLDDPDPAKASGHVVRVACREGDPLGFAVEFDSIDDTTGTRIECFVERARLKFSGGPQKP